MLRAAMINNYWTRLSKISWFVYGEQINYLPKPKLICETLTNHDILRQPSSIIVLSFDHRVCFFNEYLWKAKRSAIFTQERSQEGEKHGFHLRVSRILGCVRLGNPDLDPDFPIERSLIWSQTLFDGIAHEQTFICRQLFAGYVVGCRPMKRTKNLLRRIIMITMLCWRWWWQLKHSYISAFDLGT